MPSAPSLVLGPLLRFVDPHEATVWVEMSAACTVTVHAGDRVWHARTFAVHGHHYALVEVDGLAPGSTTPYEVSVDKQRVWPPLEPQDGLRLPPSVIRTPRPDAPPRFAFGSCRTSVGHDPDGNATHGVDAMRTFALALAGVVHPEQPVEFPDLLVFLGDQVYADETTEAMQEFIASRRDIDQPPGKELKDYVEYAHLYLLAWSDPANRWLLSTVPSTMIFDDHDVRDDWNTSYDWKQRMEATDWWRGRIVAGLASYWVYQHLGNLDAQGRSEDEIWQRVQQHTGTEELDLTEVLDAFAERADQAPETYRWSHARDLGGSRLVVVDSRAARVLTPDDRQLLDKGELEWLDTQLRGDVEHLFVATSLPFLLPAGLQHLESFDEALAQGAWGARAAKVGERIRQGADLEHWGAFQQTFRQVAEMVISVASGERGAAPGTVTFLSGDVHHSYVFEVDRLRRKDPRRLRARINQVVCSPIRNPLPRSMRFATAVMSYGVAGVMGRLAALSTRVAPLPFRYRRVKGPWFDNNLAVLAVTAKGLRIWWGTGVVEDDRHERPVLRRVAEVELPSGR